MTTPGQPPTSDAEWARETEKRLRQLESPNTVRIGPWVISSPEGDLVATKPGEEFTLGGIPEDDGAVSDVTRGYVERTLEDTLLPDGPTNPNGEDFGIPVIKDYLSGKWDDLVENTELIDNTSRRGSNLVSNPGFEKPTTLFNHGAQATITTLRPRTGLRSALMTGNGATQRLFLTTGPQGTIKLPCTAGDVFYVECWVSGAGANQQTAGGENGFSFYFDIFNRSGTQIGIPLTLTGPTAQNSLNNVWARWYGYIAIPSDSTYSTAASFSGFIQMNSNVRAGDAYYFDDPIIRVDALSNSWSALYDKSNGTTGSFGKTPIDTSTPLGVLRQVGVDATSNIKGTIDGIVTNVLNITGDAFTPKSAADAARDVRSSLDNLNVIAANIQAQEDAQLWAGKVYVEDFSKYPSLAFSPIKWTPLYSNADPGKSTAATWKLIDTVSSTFFFTTTTTKIPAQAQFTGMDSNTAKRYGRMQYMSTLDSNYQKVGIVLTGLGGTTNPFINADGGWYNYIYGRVNPAFTKYVFARISRDKVGIGYKTGTTETMWNDSVINYKVKVGATYWLECGLNAQASREFRLLENNTVVTSATDTGLASTLVNPGTGVLDATTGSGFGGYVEAGNYFPAAIGGFLSRDNYPPIYRGSGFRAFNTSANANFNVALAAGQQTSDVVNKTQQFPSNWFSNDQIATSDLVYSASTNTLTVSQPGWYLVTINQKGIYGQTSGTQPAGIAQTTGEIMAGVQVNRGSGEFVMDSWMPKSADSTWKISFGGSAVIYLAGNDQIRPVYQSTRLTSGTSYVGSPDKETYWSVTFLHNKLTKITASTVGNSGAGGVGAADGSEETGGVQPAPTEGASGATGGTGATGATGATGGNVIIDPDPVVDP